MADLELLRRDGGEIVGHPGLDLLHPRAQIVEDRGAALVRIGEILARVLGKLHHALADRALLEALGPEDAVHLGGDAVDLRKTDLVDLVRRQIGVAEKTHRRTIECVAIGQGPDPRRLAGDGEQRLERRLELPICRIDRVPRGRGRRGDERRPVRFADLIDLAKALGEGGDEHIVLRGRRDEGGDRPDRLLDQDLRRHDALGPVGRDLGDDAVEGGAEGRKAPHIGIRVRMRGEPLLRLHQLRNIDMRSRDLAHDIRDMAEIAVDEAIVDARHAGVIAEDALDNVEIDPRPGRQAGAIDRREARGRGMRDLPDLCESGRGVVGDTVVVGTADEVLGDIHETRQQGLRPQEVARRLGDQRVHRTGLCRLRRRLLPASLLPVARGERDGGQKEGGNQAERSQVAYHLMFLVVVPGGHVGG